MWAWLLGGLALTGVAIGGLIVWWLRSTDEAR